MDKSYEARLENSYWNQHDIEYATLNNKTDLIRIAIDKKLVDVNAWVNGTDICIDKCTNYYIKRGYCPSSKYIHLYKPGGCGGSRWLHWAIWAHKYHNAALDVALCLIQKGADVNATINFSVHGTYYPTPEFENHEKVTPLHIAVLISDDTSPVIESLLSMGADINATTGMSYNTRNQEIEYKEM